jgi:AraC-like DNA-binding protein
LDGNYTSKEVGLLIGYSNLSHFAAAFKKEYGVSPSDLLSKHLDIRN